MAESGPSTDSGGSPRRPSVRRSPAPLFDRRTPAAGSSRPSTPQPVENGTSYRHEYTSKKKRWPRKEERAARTIEITYDDAAKLLEATRKRAEGWRAGSASLVALIVASLALRSGNGWMATFTGWKLYALTGLIAVSLVCAAVSMWFTLRAANGPISLDTKIDDYQRPHDAERLFNRASSAASELRLGQWLLWSGVLVFSLAAFGSWLLDPAGETFHLR